MFGAGADAAVANCTQKYSRSWHCLVNVASGQEATAHPNGLITLGAWPWSPAPWNRQFQFCRDDIWRANHYGIRSNVTKKLVGWDPRTNLLVADHSEAQVYLGSLFEIVRVQPGSSRWWIRWIDPFTRRPTRLVEATRFGPLKLSPDMRRFSSRMWRIRPYDLLG